MLIEKKTKKTSLTVVTKQPVKVIKMDTALPIHHKKTGRRLSPPADQFNTGYIKAKKHDPL